MAHNVFNQLNFMQTETEKKSTKFEGDDRKEQFTIPKMCAASAPVCNPKKPIPD